MDITKIDRNFAVESAVLRPGLVWRDANRAPFRTYGIYRDGDTYRRMPEEAALRVSEKLHKLHTHTAGGRLRFVTDSPYVALKGSCAALRMPHFPLTATGGFDLYARFEEGDRFQGTFIPMCETAHDFESVVDIENPQERLITIHFPLYASVGSLSIGLQEGATLKRAPDYGTEKPVVFYGSSITQGAAASRPGMNYENILSRRLDCNHWNLGFSGSARGEREMAEYISGLDMSAFVMDYDHNSSLEQLRENHEPFFQIIRKAQPRLPILILPRPRFFLKEEDKLRRETVYATYANAKAAGDENVYFISGEELMALAEGEGSVDYIHPTDLGYFSMAQAIEKVLAPVLHMNPEQNGETP